MTSQALKLTLFALAFTVSIAHAAEPALIGISAVGDIMMGTIQPEEKLPPEDGQRIFKDSKAYIQQADIRFGNLEGALYDGPITSDSKASGPNRYIFTSPTRYVNLLGDAGFNVVSLANNHTRDLGRAGLESTKQTLRDARIQFSSKDGEVAEFNIKGTRIALIATDYYTDRHKDNRRSIVRPEATFKEIEALKKKYDIVIVSCHVGAEGKGATELTFQSEIFLGENRGNPVSFAREAIQHGADLIIMHGPHVPRALEVYNKRLIIYSLGNFATMSGIGISGEAGLAPLVRVQLLTDGTFYRGHLASFKQDRPDTVRIDKDSRALKLVERLSQSQFPVSSPVFMENGFFTSREARLP